MRLFVALTPPRNVLLELRAAVEPFSHANGHAVADSRHGTTDRRMTAAGARLRWSRPEGWHITLAFLGEVDPRCVPDLCERLSRAAARAVPMELSLAGAGHFDHRTLWLGVQGDRDRLRRLADSVNAAARRCHLATRDRPYRPHLTLARVRGGRPATRQVGEGYDMSPLVDQLNSFRSPRWFAGELDLIRSFLGPVPRYERVGHWPLTGR